MAKNMLSCRIGSYGPFELHSFEHLAGIGVKYLEYPLPSSDKAAEMLKDLLQEFDLKIGSFQANFDPLEDKKFDDQVQQAIDMAGQFDVKVLFTSIKGDTNFKKNERLFARLRVLGDRVKEKGIKVCLETHPELVLNGKVGKKTMEAINHEAIRINFDTANMYYYNKAIDSSKELEHIINYVGSVHLKDTDGKYHSWCFPALGKGIVKFPEILKRLNSASVNFFGPFTMEIEGIRGETLTLELAKQRVEDSVKYLKSIADF
nr:sugar phosphate isomerase/epimerase [Candidatus Sigynarchaeota archaeon]